MDLAGNYMHQNGKRGLGRVLSFDLLLWSFHKEVSNFSDKNSAFLLMLARQHLESFFIISLLCCRFTSRVFFYFYWNIFNRAAKTYPKARSFHFIIIYLRSYFVNASGVLSVEDLSYYLAIQCVSSSSHLIPQISAIFYFNYLVPSLSNLCSVW